MSIAQKSYRVRIRSTGLYLPEGIVDNRDMVQRVKEHTDQADFLTPEWINERVGIRTRRVFLPHENLVDSSCQAMTSALEKAGWDPGDLDFIILASISTWAEKESRAIPSTACRIQEQIGAFNAFAYDMLAACSGFVYGMAQAASFIESGFCERGALVCSETQQNGLNWADPTSCILIGDVSTVTLLEKAGEPFIHDMILRANDEKRLSKIIDLPYGGYFSLEGRKVFKEGVREMAGLTKTVMERNGFTVEDVQWFIFHQANLLMLESVGSLVGIPIERNLMNIREIANTTAGTIPSVLAMYIDNGTIQRGDKIVCTAFGGGLTSGAVLVTY